MVVGLAETAAPVAAMIAGLAGGAIVRGIVLIGENGLETGRVDSAAVLLGAEADLPVLHARYGFDAAVVTLPAAMRAASERVRRSLEALGVLVIEHPPIQDALYAGVGAEGSRAGGRRDLAGLVGRPAREIDARLARRAVAGRRVAVTGAGGSIGSELCRIVAAYEPAEMLLIERSENALFEIDREIASAFPSLDRRAILHDVVDERATRALFAGRRPEVVFHAAAHKHVPMMEDHPAHAVNNNVFGTKSVADAAAEFGAERFVLISTDKAVNPSSVMGATKRFAELYVRSLNGRGRTRCSMVRFGNVLGSSGSVLTVWANQIAAGGPVTITDPEMTRYFMTIPEAAALVVQSAGLNEAEASGADVFVLDMGEPVRIVELAERFVGAHGLSAAYEDRPSASSSGLPCVRIMFTGVRPGEKIHEELAHEVEELRPTALAGVRAWAGELQSGSEVLAMTEELDGVRHSLDASAALGVVRKWTPTMQDRVVQLIQDGIPVVGAA